MIYLILSGLAINLTPGNSYKRYIRFFVGLVTIIIAIEPIKFILNIDGQDINNTLSEIEMYMEQNEMETADTIFNYYDMGYGESIKQFLFEKGVEVYMVDPVSDKEGRLIKCTIYVEKSDYQISNIKKMISDVYNVDIDNIYIVKR